MFSVERRITGEIPAMLAIIVLASLVTFISTAALPVLDLDSPGASPGLFLVTPPSVSSTSTANSSRLGTVYAQTLKRIYLGFILKSLSGIPPVIHATLMIIMSPTPA